MTQSEQFFYDHAGYSYNPGAGETPEQGRQRCAVALARAEQFLTDKGWVTVWCADPDPDLSWMSAEKRAEEHTCEVAILCMSEPDHYSRDGWPKGTQVLRSLGGIVDADASYRRVVEAELASEVLAEMEEEERKTRECRGIMTC